MGCGASTKPDNAAPSVVQVTVQPVFSPGVSPRLAKKKVAICLSGGMSDDVSWQKVQSALEDHLISGNEECFAFDVFAHVYLFSPEHDKPFQSLCNWPLVRLAKSERWSESIEKSIIAENPSVDFRPAHDDMRIKPVNVLSMWRKISLCQSMLQLVGTKYDVIIRTRPDFLLQSNIRLHSFDLESLNIPWQSVPCRLSFDQFAVGAYAAMMKYGMLYKCVDDYFSKEKASDTDILYPERLLYHHLHASALIPNIVKMNCALVREGGKTADSYGKLREHFPDAWFSSVLRSKTYSFL